MNERNRIAVNTVAVSVSATILMCVVLFWGRWICSAMLVALLPASLVVVKGFGLSAMVILTLLIAAVWGRTWHTFTSTSL